MKREQPEGRLVTQLIPHCQLHQIILATRLFAKFVYRYFWKLVIYFKILKAWNKLFVYKT